MTTPIHYFTPQPHEGDLPQGFPSPFNKSPHPLAWDACMLLQKRLESSVAFKHDFSAENGGKMFAALVVRDQEGRIGYLAAYSGMLAGVWSVAGFAPPIFDLQQRDTVLAAGELELAVYAEQIESLQNSTEYHRLQSQLEVLSYQKDIELQSLKEQHRLNKKQRQLERDSLTNDHESLMEILKRLSFESQQDKRAIKEFSAKWHMKIMPLQQQLVHIHNEIEQLKKQRANLSNYLHKQVFKGYRLRNRLGEEAELTGFFNNKQPPGGTADCAAPKLIQWAVQLNVTPLALAEFWWGARPKGGIRHHGHYYPACRGKCYPILPFMLKGYEVLPRKILGEYSLDDSAPYSVYEDEFIVVVNKPCGLLSVPGKEVQDSVFTRIQSRYPEATGPLLVHRLDMATSGLLLIAKNLRCHKALQRQFIKRTIEKRYVAVLSKKVTPQTQGTIELPLRVDIYDRPRHRVCYEHGKFARTDWQVIAEDEHTTRVYFYPLTGRTHQLRVHAAHQEGLNAPIVGDELYGDKAQRLMLHAERLCFTHPVTGARMEVVAAAPF